MLAATRQRERRRPDTGQRVLDLPVSIVHRCPGLPQGRTSLLDQLMVPAGGVRATRKTAEQEGGSHVACSCECAPYISSLEKLLFLSFSTEKINDSISE